ncbi:MAG: PhoH family protein [Rhodothermales bacterium]|nr:PhoH family protein [Rhodothermales bacterium]
MVNKTIVIDDAEPLLLYGLDDSYLKKIEAGFPGTQIVARGNTIRLEGASSEVDQIERIVEELVSVLDRNKSLTDNDVETVLALFQKNPGSTSEDVDQATNKEYILRTPTGETIAAKTSNQKTLVLTAKKSDIVFAIGPAGTGKTYTAVALAVSALKERSVKKIVLCRPAVEAGEQLGFLPGNFKDKVDPYLHPLYDALGDMIPREKLAIHLSQNTVEIVPLAYMRGRTLNNSFVILDEAQNATTQQMKMFLTRLGRNSRAIVTGDVTQIDLGRKVKSGLVEAARILEGVDGIEFVYFDQNDVVRHKLVKEIIAAYERNDSQHS